MIPWSELPPMTCTLGGDPAPDYCTKLKSGDPMLLPKRKALELRFDEYVDFGQYIQK